MNIAPEKMGLHFNLINGRIEEVLRRYDADNDIVPGTPTVTWTDSNILWVVGRLVKLVEDLDERVRLLERKEGACNAGR